MFLDVEEMLPAGDVVALQGQAVEFEVRLGAEHNVETTFYSWFLDDDQLEQYGPALRLETGGVKLGTHSVSLKIVDGGHSGTLSWQLQVVSKAPRNRAPVIIQAVPPGGRAVSQGEVARLSVVSFDVDSHDELSYTWLLDGERLPGTARQVEIQTRGLALGSHQVTVDVADGTDRPSSAATRYAWHLEVVEPTLRASPYFSGAWPLGTPRIGPSDVLRFEVWAQIPNPEDRIRFRWEVDGVLQAERGPAFYYCPSTEEDRIHYDDHRVTCRIVSGADTGAAIAESGEVGHPVGWTVHVGPVLTLERDAAAASNRAPQVQKSGTEIPGSLVPGESRVVRVGFIDADGDVLTYRWLVDGKSAVADGPVLTCIPGMSVPGEAIPVVGVGGSSKVELRVDDGFSPSGSVVQSWDIPIKGSRSLAITPASGSVIADNGSSGIVVSGNWGVSGAGGYYGTNSLYSNVLGAAYTYNLALPASGRYDLLLWWTTWSSRYTAVPVTVHHASGTATVTVNQQVNGGQWNLIGTYDFGTSAKVVITSKVAGYSTCADAVCLSPVTNSVPTGPGNPPAAGTEFVIDDGQAGTSYVGVWSASSAPNPYNGRSLYAKGSGSYTFTRPLSSAGTYDVYAWWTQYSSREPKVPYEITHSGGVTTIFKTQLSGGGIWNLLGRFSFGSQVKVTVKVPGSYSVCADAVRFVPAGASPPPPSPTSEIIVDNGGAGTSSDGNWGFSGAPNPYGKDSLYAKDRGYYRYDVTLPAAGTYGVYVWYTQWSSRDTKVPYEVRHATGTSVIYVNQQSGGGQWQSLGNHSLATTASITVRVVDADSVCADAVRFVLGGGAPPPNGTPEPIPEDPTTSQPQITDLAAVALTPNLARVSWVTNFLGDSVAQYGTTSAASDATRTVSGLRSRHSVVLTGLVEDRVYYVRAKSSSGTTSATSAVVSFRTPDSTPSFTVINSHPRIFLTQAGIPAIRSRVGTYPFSEWWSSLLSFANKRLSVPISTAAQEDSDSTMGVAFAGLIADNSSYRSHAIAVAMQVANLPASADFQELRRRVDFLIAAYDWLYAYLTSTQRATLQSQLYALATQLESLVRDDEYAIGHSSGNQSGAFLAALAVYHEVSGASAMIARGLTRYHKYFWSFWREHTGENGGTFKSQWYTSYATAFNYEVFAAWKSATGINYYSSETWIGKLVDWYLYSLRGDMSWVRQGDTLFQTGFFEIERYLMLQLASEYKNPQAQWIANKIRNQLPVWGPRSTWEILWYNPQVAAQAPSKPLSEFFRGSGTVFMLESWNDDSVRAHFRAPPYYMNSHTHLDHCSFTLFYREGQALDTGLYDTYDGSHWRNYYGRTIAHNAILVNDPSEQFSRYGDIEATDGGQYWPTPSDTPYPNPRYVEDLVLHDYFDRGGISAYETSDLYTYSLGDGTRAYRATKMRAFYRHFLWLKTLSGWRHPVVIVFDEVESTNSSFKKTYLLHTQNKPYVSGTLLSATHGGGMVYQNTVFPKSPVIQLVGGSGMEYWVNGRNYPPERSPKPGEEAGAWRAEISPPVARTHDEFLNVLYATEAGSAAPPAARSVDAVAMKGVDTQNLVILFSVKLQSMSRATYDTTAARRNLLFGLSPATSYDVLLNGTRIATLRATVNGSLDFSTSAGGRIEVVQR